MDSLLSLFSGAQNILLLIGAAIIGGIGLLAKGRIDGARSERDRQAAKEQKAGAIADQIDNDIGALPKGAAKKELGAWSRD